MVTSMKGTDEGVHVFWLKLNPLSLNGISKLFLSQQLNNDNPDTPDGAAILFQALLEVRAL